MSALQRLLAYTRSDRARVRAAIACSILNKLFDIAPEILIGMAVDTVVNKQNSLLARWGVTSSAAQLTWLAVATFLIWFLESAFEYAYQLLWRNLAQRVQHRLRLDGYRHLQALPLPVTEGKTSGSLLALLNDDVNQLERFLDGGANSLIQVGTSVVLVGAVFFYLSPKVALLAFLPIPLILAGAFFFQRRLQPLYLQVREMASRISARLSSNVHGLMHIQSSGAEAFEAARVEADSLNYQAANSRAIRFSSAFTPVLRMAILAGFLCTLVVGGQQCLAGQLSAGSYSVLVFLTQRLLWPMTGLAATSDLYERAMASASRVLDLLDLPPVDLESGQPVNPAAVRGDLEFRDLWFTYPERTEPVLRGLSLKVQAGHTIGLVGATGSGKSTLVKLLLRFLDPQQGEILLDGQPLQQLQIRSLRACFSLVSQEVFLSGDSIADNIAYAQLQQDAEKLAAAARVAEADGFIEALPNGFEARVGERGNQLSGGQRQRLAIARAVYRDAPLMILDEATSAVDNDTEAALSRSLRRLSHGRTTLIVAHRLSTVRHADAIYVLANGTVQESGTHDQLLALDGSYARLWRLQVGEVSPA